MLREGGELTICSFSLNRTLLLGCFPDSSVGKESACNARDSGSIPGLGRSPGEGIGYPPHYSGLENSTDCIVHGVTKSQTQLSDFHFQYIIKFISCLFVESLLLSALDSQQQGRITGCRGGP